MAFITPSLITQALTCVRAEPSHEQLFLDALPIIESVTRELARRYRLSRDEQEEFGANVKLRFIDRDYAVLRRFEGRSSLATFLRTVITRQFLDERIKAWGRWRPSADAVRLGPTAVVLERMLERQHLPLDEAIEALLTRDPSLEEDMLRDLAALLPNRVTGRRLIEDTVLEHLPTLDATPEQRWRRSGRRAWHRRLPQRCARWSTRCHRAIGCCCACATSRAPPWRTSRR